MFRAHNPISRRRFGVIATTAMTAASASACGLLDGSSEESSESAGNGAVEKATIRVSVMPVIDLAPFHLAMKEGLFKAEGLDVQVIDAPSGQASLSKIVGGEADIGFSSYVPFLVAKSKNVDIKFVADSVSASPNSNIVVTKPDSEVKGVADLANRKIGVSALNTASDSMTKSAMKNNGVPIDGVQWIPIPFPDIPAALSRGDIDAAFLPEPFITKAARSIGAVPVVDTAKGPTQDFPLAGYGAKAEFADKNPKTVAAFQRAMEKATIAAADRSKIEPLLVEFAKVDPDTAKMTTLPTFQGKLDGRRIQRVADQLLEFGIIPAPISVPDMIATPQA